MSTKNIIHRKTEENVYNNHSHPEGGKLGYLTPPGFSKIFFKLNVVR